MSCYSRTPAYLEPPAWFRYDPATKKVTRTALFETSAADFSDAEVVRDFAISKDGTRVPINIIRKKGHQAGWNESGAADRLRRL